jgi:hypothetical protein
MQFYVVWQAKEADASQEARNLIKSINIYISKVLLICRIMKIIKEIYQ